MLLNPPPVDDAARVVQVFTVDHATKTIIANFLCTPMPFLNRNVFAGGGEGGIPNGEESAQSGRRRPPRRNELGVS